MVVVGTEEAMSWIVLEKDWKCEDARSALGLAIDGHEEVIWMVAGSCTLVPTIREGFSSGLSSAVSLSTMDVMGVEDAKLMIAVTTMFADEGRYWEGGLRLLWSLI